MFPEGNYNQQTSKFYLTREIFSRFSSFLVIAEKFQVKIISNMTGRQEYSENAYIQWLIFKYRSGVEIFQLHNHKKRARLLKTPHICIIN